jgi:hypothetical protein
LYYGDLILRADKGREISRSEAEISHLRAAKKFQM